MSHPLLARGAFSRPATLHVSDGSEIETAGKASVSPVDGEDGLGGYGALAVRVPTPTLPAGEAVTEITLDGTRYIVLDSAPTRPAMGSRLDWQSTRYDLRTHP